MLHRSMFPPRQSPWTVSPALLGQGLRLDRSNSCTAPPPWWPVAWPCPAAIQIYPRHRDWEHAWPHHPERWSHPTPFPPSEYTPRREFPTKFRAGGGELDACFFPKCPDQWEDSYIWCLPPWPLPPLTACGFHNPLQSEGISCKP